MQSANNTNSSDNLYLTVIFHWLVPKHHEAGAEHSLSQSVVVLDCQLGGAGTVSKHCPSSKHGLVVSKDTLAHR